MTALAAPAHPAATARLAGLSLGAAAVTGLAAGWLAAGAIPALALLAPLALLPLALWHRPRLGVSLLFGATVLVEQNGYAVGPRAGALTSRLPLFHSVLPGAGLTPVELLVALVLAVWVLRSAWDDQPLLFPSPLRTALLGLSTLVVGYLGVGLARGGDVAEALVEVRPFLYVTTGFVLAAALMTTARAVRGLLWLLVLGTAAKAAYGLVIWASVRHVQPRPEAVLAHEESFFFGLSVLLTAALWVFGVRGRLRTVSTALLPVVLLGDMVNSRRTAWAILLLGAVVLLAIAYACLPDRRPALRRAAVLTAVAAAAYLPAFWHSDSTLAQPARAIRSVVAPDARDASSDSYRVLENANLMYNIRLHGSTGTGYGIPIDYAIPIVDLTDIAPSLAYVPHNGVLYVWMRLGLAGELALWLVVAQALRVSCRLSRALDRETAVLGALGACTVVAYVIMGEKDLGFSWYRLAFATGILLGTVEARRRATAAPQVPA